MALDKCLQKRSCLQVLNFKSIPEGKDSRENENDNNNLAQIVLDKVWLTVLHLTEQLQNSG